MTQLRSFRQMCDTIREDWHAAGRDLSLPGFQAVAVYRFGAWRRTLPKALSLPLFPLYLCLFWFVRNFYGIELHYKATVGRRFVIGHQGGIVIHFAARIGDDCLVRQNVTIGAVNGARILQAPTLGNRVEVGAGAVIIGKVRIGDGARVGPNAVVTMNVPAGSMVVAPASRIIPARASKVAAG